MEYENDRFSNTDQPVFYSSQGQQDVGQQEASYYRVEDVPQPPRPPKKNRKFPLKIAAICLCCVLLGGALGVGGYWLGTKDSQNESQIYVSQRKNTALEVVQVDGKTEMTESQVYNAVAESVVSINATSTTNYFGQTTESASAGSGFIISQDGYIVTNYHVISGAGSVNVTLYSGDTYPAQIIGGDQDYDIAVLKIDISGLPAVVMGDSEQLTVGEHIVAIGNPLGELTFSMSDGIVSCCNRLINVDGTPFNMIQVTASINPGNSGGPLLNMYGEVIGIVSAKYSSYANTVVEGLGFAIPINDVRAMITDIIENGAVTNKAYLGIRGGNFSKSMAAQYDLTEGVYVYSVDEGGAAEKAGIQAGDVITKLGGKSIATLDDLNGVKKSYFAGDTAEIEVYRKGQTLTLQVTFDAVPENSQEDTTQQEQQTQTDDSYRNAWEDFYRYFFGNRYNYGYGN